MLPYTKAPSLAPFSRDSLGFVTFSKQCRGSPLPTRQGTLRAGQVWPWGCEKVERRRVMKQPDLVLVQHREESVSVTSHYGPKEGWGRELKNNLKGITTTFTSHKPPMSTKWSRKYSCGFMEGKKWRPCFQHRRYLFSYPANIWHGRKPAVDRRWEEEQGKNGLSHLSHVGFISKSISLPLLHIFLLLYFFFSIPSSASYLS